MKMAANASKTDSDAILAFYLFTRRRRRKRIYRGTYVHPILQKRHVYGKYHHLVTELHFHRYKVHGVKPGPSSRKQRTDWFTRNSSRDHRLKTRSRRNSATVPHEPISNLVRGRLLWKRLHTNCLYAIQCERRVSVRGRVRVHGRALYKQPLKCGVRLYPVQ